MFKIASFDFDIFMESFAKIANDGCALFYSNLNAVLSASMVAYLVTETFYSKMDYTN